MFNIQNFYYRYFKMDSSLKNLFISLLLYLILEIILNIRAEILLGVLLLEAFATFDTIGYESIDKVDELKVYGYRIIQIMFQILLCIIGYLIYGWFPVLIFMFLWFFGMADLKFYINQRKSINEILSYTNMTWLWWTPIGIIQTFRKKEITGTHLLSQVFLAYILLILYVVIF